jgi:hypothetical protein
VSGEQLIRESERPRYGGPAKGAGHPDDCACTRCAGFEPGNGIAIRHGSYATLALRPRAAEIADGLLTAMGDAYEDRYLPAIETAALAGARLERAMGVLLAGSSADKDTLEEEEKRLRLSRDARGWLRSYLAALERLGLTPTIGSDIVTGPVTFIVQSAFPGVRLPGADVELEAHEVDELPEEASSS